MRFSSRRRYHVLRYLAAAFSFAEIFDSHHAATPLRHILIFFSRFPFSVYCRCRRAATLSDFASQFILICRRLYFLPLFAFLMTPPPPPPLMMFYAAAADIFHY